MQDRILTDDEVIVLIAGIRSPQHYGAPPEYGEITKADGIDLDRLAEELNTVELVVLKDAE